MNSAFVTAMLAAAMIAAVPLVLAALGEAVGEKAGLLNLGIEGMMLCGASSRSWLPTTPTMPGLASWVVSFPAAPGLRSLR